MADFQLRNFYTIASLVREHDIPCEWEEMEAGGCRAYFSQDYFDQVKREVADLQARRPDLGALVRLVADRTELATKLRIPNAVGALVQTHAAKLSPYKLISWILETLIKTKSGLNLQTGTPVLSLSHALDPTSSSPTKTKWTAHTSRGTVSAPHVLLATNAYTSHLLPQFCSLIVPVRGEMSALVPSQALLSEPLSHTYSFYRSVGKAEYKTTT